MEERLLLAATCALLRLVALAPLLASADGLPVVTVGWANYGANLCTAFQTLVANYTDASVVVNCADSRDEWWRNDYENGAAKGAGPDVLLWDLSWAPTVLASGYVSTLPQDVNVSTFLNWRLYGKPSVFSRNSTNRDGQSPGRDPRSKYGFGISGDMLVFAYRSDLFYNFALDPPRSWSDAYATSSELYRRIHSGFATSWSVGSNDSLLDFTSVAAEIIADQGGSLWRKTDLMVEGFLNSNATLQSLSLARQLFLLGGSSTDTMDTAVQSLCSGGASVAATWVSLWANLDVSSCPMLGQIAFSDIANASQIGGTGIGISSYASNKTATNLFVTWLAKSATQRDWAATGGLPTNRRALRVGANSSGARGFFSSNFSDAKNNLWGLKEGMRLAAAEMPLINSGVVGSVPMQQALDAAARAGEAIVDVAYPCGMFNRPCASSEVQSISTGVIIGVIAGCTFVVIATGGGFFAWYIPHKNQVSKMENDIEMGQKAFSVRMDDITLGPLVGTGAFAEVYCGTWRGTRVAVKKMRKSRVTPEQLDLFDHEVKLMKIMRHPNILLWLGFGRTDDQLVMVTEFMANGSLATVLENKSVELTLELKAAMLKDVLQGMEYLHTFDPVILHRDLKSHNILIDAKFNCKVADFGLTIIHEHKKQNIPEGEISGSVAWTAPEVLQGGEFEKPADVYSFGIVLWEIVTRKLPYEGLNPHFVMLKVMSNDLRPTFSEEAPGPLALLSKRCWDQNPINRPTFEELTEAWPKLLDSLKIDLKKERSHLVVPPPVGKVSLVFIQVQNSSTLWQQDPEMMRTSLSVCSAILRDAIQDFIGYEVKAEGDEVLAAFSDPINALHFCCQVQFRLLEAQWPESLLRNPLCEQTSDSDGKVIWRGLRLRIGLHIGSPNCEISPVTCRMNYSGPDAVKGAKIASIAGGGMIAVSKEAVAELHSKPEVTPLGCFDELASATFRGGSGGTPEVVYRFVPERLKTRTFLNSAGSNSGHPSAMITPGELGETGESPVADDDDVEGEVVPSWLVPFSEIEVDKTQNMGFGSFGEVFAGKWRHEKVAVKFFLNQKIDQSKINDFRVQLREIAVLSTLRHPNIILFMCACVEQPNMCIVTEWMEKGSLQRTLQSSQEIPLSRSLSFAKSIAQGMAFLHDSNIMHRDLKSSNVLINGSWEVKLGDFGLSKIKSANAAKMTICGTAAWSAPEVLGSSAYSFMADVYSYGVVLWEILTRTSPFKGKHPMQIPLLVLSGERPKLPEHHNFPAEYISLMKACWDVKPENRPKFESALSTLSDLIANGQQ